MSRQSLLSIVFIASISAVAPSGAAVSLPDGATSKVVGNIGKQDRPPASTMDDQGAWWFAMCPRAERQKPVMADPQPWFSENMASKTIEDRKRLLETWKDKLPVAEDAVKSLTIRRLADGDGDGKTETSTVFPNGFEGLLDPPQGGMLHHDGVLYVACVPNLMMLRSAGGDWRAEQRKVIQDGFGVRFSLLGHGLGGLTLGPDGRIYGTMGDRGMDLAPGKGTAYNFPNQGAAFRFELDGSGFECFHTGLRNPGKIAFDAQGNAFTVDENPGTERSSRVIYLVDGGDSGWEMEHEVLLSSPERIGLPKSVSNRWIDENLSKTRMPGQPAFLTPAAAVLDISPAGMAHHPGAGFTESGAGRFFVGDLAGNAGDSGLWSFEMKPDGAGMKMMEARREVSGIAPSDVGFSPNGNLWIADSDTGQLLAVDAGAGTFLPNEAASAAKLLKEGFNQRGSAELANLLRHPDSRVRLLAQMALSRKKDALERFTEATLSSNEMVRVHGIRGLGILARCGAIPEAFSEYGSIPLDKAVIGALKKLVVLTEDRNEEIRCQSLRALADARDDAPDLNLGLLLDDESPRVRFFAAIVAGKRKMAGFFGPVCDMLAKNADKDPWLRHAGSYALGRMAPDASLLRALAEHESSSVRLAAVTGLRRMESPDVAAFLNDPAPVVVDEAVRAVCDLDLVEVRPAVAVLLDERTAAGFSPFMLRRMMYNSFRIGDAENAARVLKIAMDESLATSLREEAFCLLGCWCQPAAFDRVTGRSNPSEPRDAAEIVPLLKKTLPSIQPQDVVGITAAQGLLRPYQLDASIIPTPAPPPPVAGDTGIPAHHETANLWLYIVIGLLLVTGILLYVDPRIF